MKKITLFLSVLASVFALTGCTSTHSTITEYDSSGNIIKTTETSESVIRTVTDSTRNKTVVAWEDGWAAYISASSGTTEDPTPHGKIFAGKVNKGALSILPDQQNLPGIARIIQATKSDIEIGLDGLTATGTEVQTAEVRESTGNAVSAPADAKQAAGANDEPKKAQAAPESLSSAAAPE